MSSIKKALLTLIGSAMIVALIAGAAALVSTSRASAQADVPDADLEAPGFPGRSMFGKRGKPGDLGKRGVDQGGYLAAALDITEDELQDAVQAANEAAIDQLLDAGLITEEQAETMKERGGFLARGRRVGHPGADGGLVDYEALLADALGIGVEELEAAREEAAAMAIDAAVESGDLTQEQADLMAARRAIKDYVNPQSMMAEALGLSVTELQAALEDGKRLPELLDEMGISQEDFQDAMRAAHEAAVQQAADDGIITQEQADEILSGDLRFDHDFGGGFPGMGGRFKGNHDGFGGPCGPGSRDTAPQDTSDA